MAGETGRPSTDIRPSGTETTAGEIENALLAHGPSFSFFQVFRLLRSKGSNPRRDPVHVRPNLSLAFPPADVARVEKKERDGQSLFEITANFLGLYGVSSPLPTFYTEDLLEEVSNDKSVSREFVDIFNHRLYALFFRCLLKYRQHIQVTEEKDPDHTERLFSLLGLADERLRSDIPKPHILLRYIGLFTQFPRSSVGLQTLLEDALEGPSVTIIPCMERQVKIPEDQQICLGMHGGNLGKDSFVGEEITDRGGKFRIQIGPTDIRHFQNCFPGSEGYDRIVLLTSLYMTDPLDYDIEVILRKGEKKTACLGDPSWSCLGMNTWMFSGADQWESRSIVLPDNA